MLDTAGVSSESCILLVFVRLTLYVGGRQQRRKADGRVSIYEGAENRAEGSAGQGEDAGGAIARLSVEKGQDKGAAVKRQMLGRWKAWMMLGVLLLCCRCWMTDAGHFRRVSVCQTVRDGVPRGKK